jgi:hypothetical protein
MLEAEPVFANTFTATDSTNAGTKFDGAVAAVTAIRGPAFLVAPLERGRPAGPSISRRGSGIPAHFAEVPCLATVSKQLAFGPAATGTVKTICTAHS